MTHYVAYLLLKCYHGSEIGTTPKDLLVPFPPHGPGPIGYRAALFSPGFSRPGRDK